MYILNTGVQGNVQIYTSADVESSGVVGRVGIVLAFYSDGVRELLLIVMACYQQPESSSHGITVRTA